MNFTNNEYFANDNSGNLVVKDVFVDKLKKYFELLNTKNVYNFRSLFRSCEKLESISLGSFDTTNALFMDNMFYSCKGLKELDVSKFSTNNVTNTTSMFEDCQLITSLELSGFKTGKIKLLNKMPIPAKVKIDKISEEVCNHLADDEEYCVKITLQTQLLLEREDMYADDLYKELAKTIKQGQKEGSIIKKDALYLADLYWGNVYLYALKRLFAKNIGALEKETLNRLLEK